MTFVDAIYLELGRFFEVPVKRIKDTSFPWLKMEFLQLMPERFPPRSPKKVVTVRPDSPDDMTIVVGTLENGTQTDHKWIKANECDFIPKILEALRS